MLLKLKISYYFLHLRIHLKLSRMFKKSNNVFTVKTYSWNTVKWKSTEMWNKLVQYFLNLDQLDQSSPKTKSLFTGYFLKN